MSQIRVINNHTGDEGTVDETWLERWPEDFTELSADHVPLAVQAGHEEDLASDPAPEQEPSDGNTEEN